MSSPERHAEREVYMSDSTLTHTENITEELNTIRSAAPNEIDADLENMTSEQQYFYLLGYMAGSNKLQTQLPSIDAIEKAVCRLQTKYTDKILLYLYKEGKCYHRDLAANPDIQLSSSGLTAVIKKICACSIPLIETIKTGKFKIYYLTEAGKLYVKERLNTNAKTPALLQSVSTFSSPQTGDASVDNQPEESNDSLNKNDIQKMYQEAAQIFERRESNL